MEEIEIIENGVAVNIEVGEVASDVRTIVNPTIQKRMRRTSFQVRLGRRLDNISRKVIDNNIRLSSQPTDMLRIKVDRDDITQDLISRTITNAEIVPIIFPEMKDVPVRRLIREGENDVLIPNLYQFYDEQYWELYSPAEIRLDEDDLLLRMIYDPYSQEKSLVCLQVKEVTGTVGYSSFIYFKYNVTLYDETLPTQVVDIIKQADEKRDQLDW